MGIMVYCLLWVMQDFYPQPYYKGAGYVVGFIVQPVSPRALNQQTTTTSRSRTISDPQNVSSNSGTVALHSPSINVGGRHSACPVSFASKLPAACTAHGFCRAKLPSVGTWLLRRPEAGSDPIVAHWPAVHPPFSAACSVTTAAALTGRLWVLKKFAHLSVGGRSP